MTDASTQRGGDDPPVRARRAVTRALSAIADALEPDDNPAGVVYGTIACGSLLAAEGTRSESLLHASGAVALGLVLYWLAHAYAGALGERLQSGASLSGAHLAQHLTHSWAIVRGAFIPLLVLLLSAAAGADVEAAVTAGLISAAALLVGLEIVAGVRGGLGAREMAVQISIGAVLGIGVLALRAILG